jgi:hypothetical protein
MKPIDEILKLAQARPGAQRGRVESIQSYIEQAEARPGAQRLPDVRISVPGQHRAFVARARVQDALQELPLWMGKTAELVNRDVLLRVLDPECWQEQYCWSHGLTGVRLYRASEDPALVRLSMAAEPVETVGIASGFLRLTDFGPQHELFVRHSGQSDGALVQFADGSCVWVQFGEGSPELTVGQVIVSLGTGLEYPDAPVQGWLAKVGDAQLYELIAHRMEHLLVEQQRVLTAGMLARLAEVAPDSGVPDEQLAWAATWTPAQTATVNAWAEQLAAVLLDNLLEQQQLPDPVSSDDLYSSAWRLRALAERRDMLENLLVLLRERRSATLDSLRAAIDEMGTDLVMRTGLRVTFATDMLERAALVCPMDWWTGGTLELLLDDDIS